MNLFVIFGSKLSLTKFWIKTEVIDAVSLDLSLILPLLLTKSNDALTYVGLNTKLEKKVSPPLSPPPGDIVPL
jgi:hypothetical protein